MNARDLIALPDAVLDGLAERARDTWIRARGETPESSFAEAADRDAWRLVVTRILLDAPPVPWTEEAERFVAVAQEAIAAIDVAIPGLRRMREGAACAVLAAGGDALACALPPPPPSRRWRPHKASTAPRGATRHFGELSIAERREVEAAHPAMSVRDLYALDWEQVP